MIEQRKRAGVRLALCRFDCAHVERAVAHLARAGLPQKECERLHGIRNPNVLAASVAARMSLLWVLSGEEGLLSVHDFDEVPPLTGEPLFAFCRTERGPVLEGCDLGISLAHSESLAVCAVAERRRVGVDIEPQDRVLHISRTSPPLFSEGECALLASAPERDREFLRIWTRKEALGKALGTGLHNSVAALDTTAYSEDCFIEHIIEGAQITVFVAPEEPWGGQK